MLFILLYLVLLPPGEDIVFADSPLHNRRRVVLLLNYA